VECQIQVVVGHDVDLNTNSLQLDAQVKLQTSNLSLPNIYKLDNIA